MKRAADIRPGDEVMALSLWEPWAKLMAIGAKRIETRRWSTGCRGALLICAAARKHKGELESLCREPAFRRALGHWPTIEALMETLYYGHAVALVDLENCFTTNTYIDPASTLHRLAARDDEEHFGDYSPGRFGWVTSGLRRIVPFRQRGAQGLFRVTMPDFEDWS